MLVTLETNKIIGDPVHGYIRLTDLEYDLLQLPILNRLHYIHQTATAQHTFPGSVTTRFSHVIGAMYLGGKIISQILRPMEPDDFNELFPVNEIDSKFIVEAVRLSCLFHDIGHGPFSHSSEEAMLKVMSLEKYKQEIPIAAELFNKDESKPSTIPIHEYFSYKIIRESEIKDIILKQKGQAMIDIISELLTKSTKGSIVSKNPLGMYHIRKIVSGQLDADRMDYLLRDSLMSGVQFGQVDVHRIIDNMALVKDDKDKFHIAFHERSLGNVEDMLDARFKMYKWFYNHHTVMATNRLMEIAIRLMLEDDISIGDLFHWSSYSSGRSTDEIILLKLREFIEKDKDRYGIVRGLIDRRYLPISLFKTTPDYRRLRKVIDEKIGTEQPKETLQGMITTFIKGDYEKKITDQLEKIGSGLEKCIVFSAGLERKTYSSFHDNPEKVYLYKKPKKRFCELLTESEYFKNINDEWGDFPNVFVFYLIPNQEKKTYADYADKIRDVIATEISKLAPN